MLMTRYMNNIRTPPDHILHRIDQVLVSGITRILHTAKYTTGDRIERADHRQGYKKTGLEIRQRKNMLLDSIITSMFAMRVKSMMHGQNDQLVRIGADNI